MLAGVVDIIKQHIQIVKKDDVFFTFPKIFTACIIYDCYGNS